MTNITLHQLSIVFQKIINKLEFERFTEINLTNDFYNLIPTEDWAMVENYNVDIGSLGDDIHNLKLLAINEERPCTYVDFDRLARQ
jgi:hypothetical protein